VDHKTKAQGWVNGTASANCRSFSIFTSSLSAFSIASISSFTDSACGDNYYCGWKSMMHNWINLIAHKKFKHYAIPRKSSNVNSRSLAFESASLILTWSDSSCIFFSCISSWMLWKTFAMIRCYWGKENPLYIVCMNQEIYIRLI